jgi:Domain of unknown function (DUF2019)
VSHQDIESLDDDQLIEVFTNAAREMGSAVLDSSTGDATRAFRQMEAVRNVLQRRGKGSELALAPLLDDKERFVRYYAAQFLSKIVPDRARKVIEENAKLWFDAIAGDAAITLRALDRGDYN